MRVAAVLLPVVIIFALTIGCIQPATTSAPTIVAPVTTPAHTAAPYPASGLQSPAVTTSPSPNDNSGQGVWVRIVSDGAYTGTVGTGGRLRDVNGTGEHFYQIPAASTDIVEISLQNLDTSGKVMTVEVFDDGEMIENRTIKTPGGTLMTTVDLKTVQMLTVTEVVARGMPVPRVSLLKYNPGTRYSACRMGQYFPDIVADPNYGLNGPSNSRLSGFSEGQYSKMIRESTEKQGAIDPCPGPDASPYWTWLEFTATLNLIASQPVTYNITLYTSYMSEKIPVVNSTETLYPGQDYPYKVLVPIKSDQVDKINSMDMDIEPEPQ